MNKNKELDLEFDELLKLLSNEEKLKNKILGTYTLQVLTGIKYLKTLIVNFQVKGRNE